MSEAETETEAEGEGEGEGEGEAETVAGGLDPETAEPTDLPASERSLAKPADESPNGIAEEPETQTDHETTLPPSQDVPWGTQPEEAPVQTLTAVEENDEPGPGARLAAWTRQNPFFAAFLLFLVFGSPYLVLEARTHFVRSSLQGGLDAWQARLGEAGLPVPALPPRDVPPPPQLDRHQSAVLQALGLEDRYVTLRAWSDLAAGRTPERLPAGGELGGEKGAWGEAILACATLRTADEVSPPSRELVDRARDHGERSPEHVRPILRLARQLVLGDHREVMTRAQGMLRGKQPPECVGALRALDDEAARRRIRAVLGGRPPSGKGLIEVLGFLDREGLGIEAALLAEAPSLHELVAPGEADLERATSLLKILTGVFPGGRGAAPGPLADAWPAVQTNLAAILSTHVARLEEDLQPSLDVVSLAVRFDPESDLPPLETFSAWREQLRAVVDRPSALLAYAIRFLEFGWLPAGLEELLASHYLRREARIPTSGSTPGGLLGISLLEGLQLLALARDDPEVARGVSQVLRRHGELEVMLADRRDPAAERIRAQAAFLLGRLLTHGSQGERALEQLEAAKDLGYEPRFRLLQTRAICLRGLGKENLDDAVASTRERLAILEKHGSVLGGSTAKLLPLELTGYPVHRRTLDAMLARTHLDLARLLQAQGNRSAARAAALRGMQTPLRSGQAKLRQELRDLLRELGPN